MLKQLRRRPWVLHLVLWGLPIAAVAGLWSHVAASPLRHPDHYGPDTYFFRCPTAAWWSAAALAIAASFGLATVSRRALGWLAAASIVWAAVCLGAGLRGQSRWTSVSVSFPPSNAAAEDGAMIGLISSGGAVSVSVWRSGITRVNELWWRTVSDEWNRQWITTSDRARESSALTLSWERRPMNWWNLRGFDFAIRPSWTTHFDRTTLTFTAAAPWWCLALPSAAFPIAWTARRARQRRAKRRRRAGRCAACGYDLRASAHRCPECGAESATA